VRVLGLDGSVASGSTGLGGPADALRLALEGAAAAGAVTEVIEVGRLDLPLFAPGAERDPPEAAGKLAEAVYSSNALVLSGPLVHGSISGAFKNALDWIELLAHRDPPYLRGKVVGLVAATGGTDGLQAINAMALVVRAFSGWAVPLVAPAARTWLALGRQVRDETVAVSLKGLGEEIVRAARQVARSGTCDYADHPLPGPDPARRGGAELSFAPFPGPGNSDGG
jgi:FMN reductase